MVDDPRDILQLFEYVITEELTEDLILKSEGGDLLKYISRVIFEVDPVNFVMKLEEDIIIVEFKVDIETQDIFDLDLSHLNVVHLHEFMDDLKIFRDILNDPVLRVHHDVLAGVNHCLNPEVSLAGLVTFKVILMGSFEAVMAIEDVKRGYFLEGLRECSLTLLDFPKGVMSTVASDPL